MQLAINLLTFLSFYKKILQLLRSILDTIYEIDKIIINLAFSITHKRVGEREISQGIFIQPKREIRISGQGLPEDGRNG